MSHSVAPFGLGTTEALREIKDPQSLIGIWPDQKKLFRPYGRGGWVGTCSAWRRSRISDRNRYTSGLWNLVPVDWRNQGEWVEDCIAGLGEADWDVVVMHEIPALASHGFPSF
jgi:hypothetical protein